jgi:hypothetical protein
VIQLKSVVREILDGLKNNQQKLTLMKLIEIFKMKYILKSGISGLLMLYLTFAYGETPLVHSVISEENGRVFQYSIVNQEINIKTKALVMYFWHRNGQLRNTEGDYSGNILHGYFREFDKSGRMLEKGTYYYGAKDGEWKSWNKNGDLIRLEKWDQGFLIRRISYDLSKCTIENFNKNKLNGRRIVLNNKRRESVEHFKNGVKVNRNKKKLSSFIFFHGKQKKKTDVVNTK